MSAVVEIVETPAFNASFAVTDLLMKTLENAAKTVAVECVKVCSNQYGFNADEALLMLGLENLSLNRKMMAKKGAGIKQSKQPKQPKAKKSDMFILPFCSGSVNPNCCQGISYNRGLFTQCSKELMENSIYCNGCQADALTNASGIPSCGNVEARLATGLYDYKDSKGRKPVSYTKILNKMKLTNEDAIEAAKKLNIIIDEEHFVVAEKAKKSSTGPRGRPKKVSSVVNADGAADLFAQLQSDDSDNESQKSNKLSQEEKAAKKAALEEERRQKKAEKEALIAAEKAEKEEKRKAEAAEKKAEKEAKRNQEKAEKKAEREAKRLQEKAEKEAKRNQEKAEKKSNKNSKSKEVAKPEEQAKPQEVAKPEEEAKTQKVTVTRIKINDVEYLKSSNNILYNPKTREEVGLYDPITKTISELPEDDDDEEEEDGYESE